MKIVKVESEEELISAATEYYKQDTQYEASTNNYINFYGPDYYVMEVDWEYCCVHTMLARDKFSALQKQKCVIQLDIDKIELVLS